MNQIEKIIDALVSNDIAVVFAILIAIIFILALLARFRKFAPNLGGLDNSGPTLLTTIGVLGTFTGVFFGLLDFDVDNIDDSVPHLLAGLKIAFITSILGIASAIILKIIQSITPSPITGENKVTPEIIHATLESIKKEIEITSDKEQGVLSNIWRSISVDSDSSLSTQIEKLRNEIKDGQNELKNEFNKFSETLAENNSKALIKALESVIRDFNTQLNEQFGENFKQLNEAVAALLSWQESYRRHIETLEITFTKAQQGIESSEVAIRNIASHTETIPETLKELEHTVHLIRESISDLNEHLEVVSELKDKALTAFPTIEQNLNQLTESLSESVNDVITQSSEALKKQQDANNLIGDNLDNTAKIINEQFSEFERKMQEQIYKNLGLLGKNLASLSEKFVEDYGPLTEQLHKIVNISRGI